METTLLGQVPNRLIAGETLEIEFRSREVRNEGIRFLQEEMAMDGFTLVYWTENGNRPFTVTVRATKEV